MRRIMFVCTGNICRSAMAEKMLIHKVISRGIGDKFLICSSGIYAFPQDKSTYEAVKIMNDEYQIDLSSHRATATRNSQIEEMDLILCMTYSHKNTLKLIYPNLENKIFVIKEYIGLEGEVADPYGGTLKTYSECAKELNYYLNLLLEKEGF